MSHPPLIHVVEQQPDTIKSTPMGAYASTDNSAAVRRVVPRTTKAADKFDNRLKPMKAKKLPAIKDSSNLRPPKHTISPTKKTSHLQSPSRHQPLPVPKQSKRSIVGKRNSQVTQPSQRQTENILQLSKKAINTDSSQMLYPDFTANLGGGGQGQSTPHQQMVVIDQDPTYQDINKLGARKNMRKVGPTGKHKARVPALNQTDYFSAKPGDKKGKNAGGFNAPYQKEGDASGGYIVFDQTMDTKDGTRFDQRQGPKSHHQIMVNQMYPSGAETPAGMNLASPADTHDNPADDEP